MNIHKPTIPNTNTESTLPPNRVTYIFVNKFFKTHDMSGHKTSLNQFKKIKNIQSMFSNIKEMKQGISNKSRKINKCEKICKHLIGKRQGNKGYQNTLKTE